MMKEVELPMISINPRWVREDEGSGSKTTQSLRLHASRWSSGSDKQILTFNVFGEMEIKEEKIRIV